MRFTLKSPLSPLSRLIGQAPTKAPWTTHREIGKLINRTEISAGILAGGEARRLGGVDKGLISCGNKPFANHLRETMQAHVAHILLSANRNLAKYVQIGFKPLPDKRDGYLGPLAGIETLLANCETEWLWLMPVDAILQPSTLLASLLKAQQESGDLKVAVKVDGRENPVCALLHKSQLASLSAALDADQRSVIRWLNNDVTWVDFHQEDNQWIWSVNTPQQLAQAEHQLLLRQKG
jgi:molybdopterin-guanine dinucleotide biosynthesis protein A